MSFVKKLTVKNTRALIAEARYSPGASGVSPTGYSPGVGERVTDAEVEFQCLHFENPKKAASVRARPALETTQ